MRISCRGNGRDGRLTRIRVQTRRDQILEGGHELLESDGEEDAGEARQRARRIDLPAVALAYEVEGDLEGLRDLRA